MLQHRLSTEQLETVPLLHRRAALWFAAHDHPVEATRHAVSAGDWALLSELLVTRVVARLVSVERQALGRVLDKLPLLTVKIRPRCTCAGQPAAWP
jgi:ATP/maltotriose-dependent transcriptional regulator MalT